MFRIKLLVGVLVAFLLLPSAVPVMAQNEQTANGMQISPTRTEMSLLPGETKDFTVSVRNVADVALTIQATINDFESDGVTGTPQIIVDDDVQVASSLKGFVEGLGIVNVEPKETKEVDLTVTLPEDAIPGVYYGAIRFTVIPGEDAEEDEAVQVSLNASVASLLFVEVPGDITQQIQIESMQVCDIDVSDVSTAEGADPDSSSIVERCEGGGNLFLNAPTVSSIKIANTGNGFSRPFGRVVLEKGGTEVHSYELNNSKPRGVVLPDSTRVFSSELSGIDSIGRYTLTANLSYGDGGEVFVQTVSFWYVPAWVFYTLVLVLLALIIGAVIIYRHYKAKMVRRR